MNEKVCGSVKEESVNVSILVKDKNDKRNIKNKVEELIDLQNEVVKSIDEILRKLINNKIMIGG